MRFHSYFTKVSNVHISKDVGLLPWHIGQAEAWASSLVGHFVDEAYPSLEGELDGLEVRRLDDAPDLAYLDRSFLRYLREEAIHIDVLQLWHLGRDSIVYGTLYKRYNPKGLLYLKLDAYNTQFEERKRYSMNLAKNMFLKWVETRFLEALDLASVENRAALSLISNTYPELASKLVYAPNGANDSFLSQHFPEPEAAKPFLLCVSRPGSQEKNCELLLRSLPHLRLASQYRIVLVGPGTEAFRLAWAEALLSHPEWRDRMEWKEEITDRLELYRLYSQASVCFLPSRVESFGIAYVEALYFGAMLVGHRGMFAYPELCDQGAYGTFYDDNDEASFAKALEEAVEMSERQELREAARKYARKHFAWSSISDEIRMHLLEAKARLESKA